MDFFTLIIAVAGLVWIGWFLLRGSLIAGCMATIIGASCFGYLFWHSEGGPVPLSIDRCLVGLLGVAYVVHRGLGLTDPKPLRSCRLGAGCTFGNNHVKHLHSRLARSQLSASDASGTVLDHAGRGVLGGAAIAD